MKRPIAPLLLVLPLLFVAQAVQAQTHIISGSVLGHNGEPIPVSHVSLYPSGGEALIVEPVAADGSYAMEVDTSGVFTLWYTGVNHIVEEVPLLLAAGAEDVALDVQLQSYPYKETFDKLRIIGDFNDFSFGSGAIPLEKQSDGTFAADVPVEADTLAYQVLDALDGHGRSINGTMTDWYRYDGGGDYRSVIEVEGETARVVFDPDELIRDPEGVVVSFEKDGLAARYARVVAQMKHRTDVFREGYDSLRAESADAEDLKAYSASFDWSETTRLVREVLQNDPPVLFVKSVLLSYTIYSSNLDSLIGRRMLDLMGPLDPMWTGNVTWMLKAIRSTSADRMVAANRYEDYMLTARMSHRDPDVRARLLLWALGMAAYEEDAQQVGKLYSAMMEKYSDTFYAERAKARYAPDRAVQPGNPVPDFAIASISDSTVTYSRESMTGKIYLLDFWATWCGPCIAELPNLTNAYEQFKDDGFTILSLSFDSDPELITNYQQESDWKMPWLHAFVDGGFGSELAKTFGVVGIPKPILVGADGEIIATESNLRGEELIKTIEEALAAQQSASSDMK